MMIVPKLSEIQVISQILSYACGHQYTLKATSFYHTNGEQHLLLLPAIILLFPAIAQIENTSFLWYLGNSNHQEVHFMAGFGILKRVADENRKFFIKNCIQFDTPRLQNEQYPDGVNVESDIPYIEGENVVTPSFDESLCSSLRVLDIYTPENSKADEIFLLIHGGAFVYGCKELDKCFGMHLAKKSGITVANINYRLLPTTDLQGVLSDVFAAVTFLSKKGFSKFHTIGDSAGGYLCLITALLLNSKQMRDECGLSDFSADVCCPSTSPICGDHIESPRQFAGIFFDPDKKMPSYIYDLGDAVEKYGCPPCVLTTGDQDMMLKQNDHLYKRLKKMGITVEYYCAETTEETRPMHHVYAIAHPEWPEGIKTIDLTIENAKR